MDEREPILIAAGDTACWSRYLPNWLPSAGWYVLGEVRGHDQPTGPAISFKSAPDATGTVHEIKLAAATTATWAAGESSLVEYAVNDALAQRHLLYQNNLRIEPNLGTGTNQVDVETFAQRMIRTLQATLLELVQHAMKETDIQKVRVLREDRKAIRYELAYWEEKRREEIGLENVLSGRPSGRKITPIFKIIDYGGPGLGNQNPFVPNS
jgi:hypothetical protein